MLDWSKIDNEKKFQQLVNDLFALEVGKPGFIPSSPYIGPDGGWDGRFPDEYQGCTGMSCVQSKWTIHGFDDAYGPLRGEVKKELVKGKKNNVDNLFFATNAELKIGPTAHVGNLEALNSGEVKKLFVFHREKLQSMIEKYPLLKHKYFNLPQRPFFVPYPDYLAESEISLVDDDGLFTRFGDIDAVKQFLTDNQKKILVVHSPQGEGKSHFLIQLAKEIDNNSDWQCWFCRPSIRTVEDAIQDEILPGCKYVLILDNADLYEEVAKKLIDIASKTPSSQIKLVFTARESGKEEVLKWMSDKRIVDYLLYGLGKMPEQALISLLEKVSGGKKIEHPERMVRSLGSNPFFIVTYGRLQTGKTSLNEVKQQVKDSIESAANALTRYSFSDKQRLELLKNLAAIIPLRLTNNDHLSKIADQVGKTKEEVTAAIEHLVKIGVLRYVGNTIRFNPDLNGSVYLSLIFDTEGGEKDATKLIKDWMPIEPKNTMINIAAAGGHTGSINARKAVAALVRQKIAESNDQGNTGKRNNLSNLKPVTYLAPEDIVDLLSIYLGLQENPDDISRDLYGSIILELIHIPGFQKQALDLIRILSEKNINGQYSNYEARELVETSCSPLELNSFDSAMGSLMTLDNWADEENLTDATIDLIIAGVKEALAGSHDYRDSYGLTLTWGRRGLNYSPKVDEYRSFALSVAKKMLKRKEVYSQTRAASLLNDIGHDSYTNTGPFWDRIVNDKKQLLDWIEELIHTKELPNPLLAEIEESLIMLWSNNAHYPALSKKAGELLEVIERSPEFLIYKMYTGHHFIVRNFKDFIDDEPGSDRWSWLVHNRMVSFREDNASDLSDLAEAISKKYETPDEVIEYLSGLSKSLRKINWGYIPLIEEWAKYNLTPLLEIVKDVEMFKKVPDLFKNGFHRIAAKNIKNYIDDLAESLEGSEKIVPGEIDRLIDLVMQNNVPRDTFIGWIEKIVNKLDDSALRILWNRAPFIFNDGSQKAQELFPRFITLLLDKGLTTAQLDACDMCFHFAVKEKLLDTDKSEEIKSRLVSALVKIEKLPDSAQNLLEYIFEEDLPAFLAFLEGRFISNKEKPYSYLYTIPFNGFELLSSLVKNYADFKVLAEKIGYWAKADLISSFDTEHLLENLLGRSDAEKGNYLEAFIKESVQSSDEQQKENAVTLLSVLPFAKDTIPIFILVLEGTEGTELYKKAEDALVHAVVAGEYSGIVGEVPKAMSDKKETLEKMKEIVKPGMIKNLVVRLIEHMDGEIKSHIARDQELMNN